MRFLRLVLMGLFIVSGSAALTACEQESNLEEGAEEISEGAEEVADEIDDATTE